MPARLLVVDDEATILELLSGSLRLAGFEVMTASSGAEAVRAAASGDSCIVRRSASSTSAAFVCAYASRGKAPSRAARRASR